MATEALTITAMPSVSIAGYEGSPNPSSEGSPTARQGGKRKNHRGGKRSKKKSANRQNRKVGSATENNETSAETVNMSWNEPAKEQKPNIDKKKYVEKANDQPKLALEPIEIASPNDEVSAVFERSSEVLSRLAILEALELEAEAGCNKALNNARNDSLVNCRENGAAEASSQEIQEVTYKATVMLEDNSILNELEQEHTQNHFSNSPDQHRFDTDEEEVASRVWEDVTIAAGQKAGAKETSVHATAGEADRHATIEQSKHVVNEDNEEWRKKVNTGSETGIHNNKSAANNDAAAPQDVLNISRQDCACVTTTETIVIGAPQDTATTATQWVTKAEAEDSPTAAVEEINERDSTVTPDNYAVSEHVPLPKAGKEIHGVADIVGLASKELEINENGNFTVAATVASAGVAVHPKSDLPLSTKLYEINSIANKGIGMFSTHFIPRGTRILREPPLLLLEKSHGEEIYHVPLRFQQLSPADQASYLTLAATLNADRDPGRLEWLQILSETPIHAELDLPMAVRQQVLQIFETNSFSADAGSAIVYEASRMNHSCTPNVYHNWNAALGRCGELTVHAIRDISPGEEILTSYINICAYQSARQEQLDRYGFQCDCAACDTRTQFGRDSEARRQRLCVVNRGVVERYLCPDRSVLDGDDGGTLDAVVEIIRLLQAECVVHMELTRHYRLAYTITAMLGDFKQACIWAEKALELTRVCTGADYVSYAQDEENLRMLVERVRADEVMAVGRFEV